MELGLKIEKAAGWNLVWCEESKASVTMEDSFGNKAASVLCHSLYSNMDEDGSLRFFARGWKPAVGSQWVQVKGAVPFVVSAQDAMSQPVAVKLVKGFSVPVMLKGAGLADENGKPVDVQATVTVEDYKDAGEKGEKLLRVELSSDRELGFRSFELQTMKGQPLITEDVTVNGFMVGSCSWSKKKTLQMSDVPEGEVRVMVKYAGVPRRVMAVVDARAALSGFGNGEGGAVGGNVQPEAGKTFAAVAVQPGSSQEEPAVKVKLDGFDIRGSIIWENDVRKKSPPGLVFDVRLETTAPSSFGDQANFGEQSLEVTDSTGRVLKPAAFNLDRMDHKKGNGVNYVVVEGKGPELASRGAEWVRVKGTLRVPMARVKESPVYELPLEQGVERHVPVPGLEETGADAGDVATAGDAPTCKLWLEEVDRKAGDILNVKVSLRVDGVPFDLEDFELVDDKGAPLYVYFNGCSCLSNSSEEWSRLFTVGKAVDMKQLRVKLKYKTRVDTVSVPIDMKVGLGGPVPEKKAENESR